MNDSFDAYYEWLGIPPAEQPPHHYRLLGVGLFEENSGAIANAADRQMGHLRGFATGKHSQLSQKLLNEVASARVCLLNPEKKATYDAQLRKKLAVPPKRVPQAVAVASRPVDDFSPRDPAPVVPAEANDAAKERFAPPPAVLAVSVAAGVVLLGALVWWLSGSGSRQPPPHVAAEEQERLDPEVLPDEPIEPERDGAGRPRASGEADQPHRPFEPPEGDPADAETSDTPGREPREESGSPEEPAGTAPEDSTPERPDAPASTPDADGPVYPLEVSEGPGRPPMVTDGPPQPPEVPESPEKPLPPAGATVAKTPVPDPAAQREVRRMLDETYDTTAARPLPERLAMVDQLASLAEKSDDGTERFVLLRRASEMASDAGDGQRMMQLARQIADEFEVDRLRVEAAMLDAFSKKAGNEEQLGVLVRNSASVIDDAIAAERFDLADSLSAIVHRACQASAGRPFRVETLNRRRKVQQLRVQWDEFQAASTALQSNPDDEAAHTTVARWYCFVRHDWDQALRHFAKGSQPELSALANRELKTPDPDATTRVELADAWWDLAETSDPEAKPAFLRRAAYWYERASPEVTSTLLKAKVTKRLAELDQKGEATPQHPETSDPPPAVAPFDAQQAARHQQAWAKHLNVPVEEINPIGMRMRLIPPGEFLMGTTEEAIQTEMQMSMMQADRSFQMRLQTESPQHRVRITRPFWMSATEVTQEQYFRVMGAVPTRIRAPNLPVERVAWLEAAEFCRRLTQASGKKLGDRVYRLPTEAEWEYACRAGSTTRFHFGDEDGVLLEHAWFALNSGRRTQPVATRRPNPWGLFDMYGNVAEWVVDWDSRDYYAESPVDDPMGPLSGWGRMVRGGHFSSIAPACRSASREREYSENRSWNVGFRVVLVAADAVGKMHVPDAGQPDSDGGNPKPAPLRER